MAENTRRNEVNAPFDKESRARDGKKAMSEYEAEGIAIRAKTERLRAMRLAREAAEPPVVKPAPKTAAKGAAKGATKVAAKAGTKAAAPKKKAAKPKKEKSTLSAWLDGQETDGRRG